MPNLPRGEGWNSGGFPEPGIASPEFIKRQQEEYKKKQEETTEPQSTDETQTQSRFRIENNILYYHRNGENVEKHFGDLEEGENIVAAEDIGGKEIKLKIEGPKGERELITDLGDY